MQAVIITLTSFACQLLRRKPLTELLRELNVLWVKQLCVGGLIGSALMLVPALILGISGWVLIRPFRGFLFGFLRFLAG
jgi:hypothetical protein